MLLMNVILLLNLTIIRIDKCCYVTHGDLIFKVNCSSQEIIPWKKARWLGEVAYAHTKT